jgi:molybdate transport system substrate-binding protein
MYDPLHQDMVLLTQGSTNPAALAFVDFLLGDEAQQIARRYGYGTD